MQEGVWRESACLTFFPFGCRKQLDFRPTQALKKWIKDSLKEDIKPHVLNMALKRGRSEVVVPLTPSPPPPCVLSFAHGPSLRLSLLTDLILSLACNGLGYRRRGRQAGSGEGILQALR